MQSNYYSLNANTTAFNPDVARTQAPGSIRPRAPLPAVGAQDEIRKPKTVSIYQMPKSQPANLYANLKMQN